MLSDTPSCFSPLHVPSTLEDALTVTRHLDRRCLWTDWLCIEQGNSAGMATQIPLVSAVFTGAYATIINFTGWSAHSELPRVGTLEGIISQRCCKVENNWLLSTMPTMAQ